MPKAQKPAFYAVHKGLQPGIYFSWDDCEKQIKGFPKARFKKFSTAVEADAFVKFGTESRVTRRVVPEEAGSSKTQIQSGTEPRKRLVRKVGKQRIDEIKDESGWEVVYTDGACHKNGKIGAIAGIGVWWGPDDPRNLAERCPGDQTNNRAELIAIIRVLETTPYSNRRLLIKTDSSYSISCVRDWIPSWRNRNWKTSEGKDVKNKALIIYLSHLLDERSKRGQIARLQHVPAHVGIVGNEAADRLAGFGTSFSAMPDRDWTLPKEESDECRQGTQQMLF